MEPRHEPPVAEGRGRGPGELVREPALGRAAYKCITYNISVAILLSYGTARVSSWLATLRRGRSTGKRFVHEVFNGHQRSETTHTLSEPGFRARLSDGAPDLELALV